MLREILIYLSVYIGLFTITFYILSFRRKPKILPKFPKNPPKVSIIVPAYNEEKGIQETIENALNLDYPKDKFEIIVVDDGSKDDTFRKASRFRSKNVKVFRLDKNSGKGHAMNYGIKKSKGEIIVTMDADNTTVKPYVLKSMISYFSDPKVMCVAPVIAISHPKGILKRVQQIEYMLGVFLRKAFSNLEAVHITPGAFSVYKKSFFEKYGYFDERNLTEDMEMALRIQYNHYGIANDVNAIVFTPGITKFKPLMLQRRRWYIGLLRNFLNYKKLFSREYGDMGTIVLPVAIITIILSVILTSYLVINTFFDVKREIALYSTINFDIFSNLELTWFFIERFLFKFFSDPVVIFFLLFVLILVGYMIFAKTKIKEHSSIRISLFCFIIFYSFLFAFWWIISFFYTIFKKKVIWR